MDRHDRARKGIFNADDVPAWQAEVDDLEAVLARHDRGRPLSEADLAKVHRSLDWKRECLVKAMGQKGPA